MGKPSTKPSTEVLIQAAEKYGGVTKDVAKAFNKTKETIRNWRKKDKAFDEAMKVSIPALLNSALEGLRYHVEIKKSEKSIHYTLTSLGKDLGFGNRQIIEERNKIDEQLNSMSDEELNKLITDVNKKISNDL